VSINYEITVNIFEMIDELIFVLLLNFKFDNLLLKPEILFIDKINEIRKLSKSNLIKKLTNESKNYLH